MTTLVCPSCYSVLDRKRSGVLGEDILRCRACKKYSIEGSGQWLTGINMEQLRQLIKQRDEDKARHQHMMNSSITDPMWEQIS